MDKILLTVEEVAHALSVSRSMAYKLVNQGAVPSIRMAGVIRVKADDLREWIDNGCVKVDVEAKGNEDHC